MRSRTEEVDLIAKPVGLTYEVVEEELSKGSSDGPKVTYQNARDAVERILSIHKRWRVPLGDVEFADKDGAIAVTWRHLKVRLPTMKWVLEDNGAVIAGILEEAAST
jgi:hypothetical protein